MDQQPAFDAFLDHKIDLFRIDKKCYLQLLQYSPLWPLGAREYLIITSEVSTSTPRGEGFIIASTSIDDICEDAEAYSRSSNNYTRSSLRLAGYIGSPNGCGGTDLQLFVDMDVYQHIPGWLVQTLAQICLADLMTRIRLVALGFQARRQRFVMDDISHRLKKQSLAHVDAPAAPVKQKLTLRELALFTRDEGIEVLEAYLSGKCVRGRRLDWKEKLHKQGIRVCASPVSGSDWQAVKATVSIPTDAQSIVRLLLDDAKIGLYDDLFDTCDVRFYQSPYFRYNPSIEAPQCR